MGRPMKVGTGFVFSSPTRRGAHENGAKVNVPSASRTRQWGMVVASRLLRSPLATVSSHTAPLRRTELEVKPLPMGDRKSVVEGKSVAGRVALGGRRIITKKKEEKQHSKITF